MSSGVFGSASIFWRRRRTRTSIVRSLGSQERCVTQVSKRSRVSTMPARSIKTVSNSNSARVRGTCSPCGEIRRRVRGWKDQPEKTLVLLIGRAGEGSPAQQVLSACQEFARD